MKLKSAFFAVVLLLLTVTVCVAQSPMGVSPTEFYEAFDIVNTYLEGPECYYQIGNEEDGAYILTSITSGLLGINMEYSGKQVTKISLAYKYLSGDEEAWDAVFDMTYSTLATLWAVRKYESGIDLTTLNIIDLVDETGNAYFRIELSSEPVSFWGFRFEKISQEEDGYKEGLLIVTKSD